MNSCVHDFDDISNDLRLVSVPLILEIRVYQPMFEDICIFCMDSMKQVVPRTRVVEE